MYQLTKKGSVGWHDQDGRYHGVSRGEQIEQATFESLSERQQAYFDEVEEEVEKAEVEAKTVEEIKEALDEAEVEYGSKARKADLVKLYEKNIENI